MVRHFTLACLAGLVALLWLADEALCARYLTEQELAILGDSLSDNGNLFALTQGQTPNASFYFEGRFSDGPVWNERLAAGAYLKLSNVALGGAEACNSTLVPSLLEQVKILENTTTARDNTVVSFTIGGNDYLTPVRRFNMSPPAPERIVGCITSAVKMLIELGYKRFLVWNLPNPAPSNGPANPLINALAPLFISHNQLLADQLQHLKYDYPEAHIDIFDFFEASNLLFSRDANQFRFPNVPCLVFTSNNDIPDSICENPSDHIMYDDLHPTSRVHLFLAEQVFNQLYSAGWI